MLNEIAKNNITLLSSTSGIPYHIIINDLWELVHIRMRSLGLEKEEEENIEYIEL